MKPEILTEASYIISRAMEKLERAKEKLMSSNPESTLDLALLFTKTNAQMSLDEFLGVTEKLNSLKESFETHAKDVLNDNGQWEEIPLALFGVSFTHDSTMFPILRDFIMPFLKILPYGDFYTMAAPQAYFYEENTEYTSAVTRYITNTPFLQAIRSSFSIDFLKEQDYTHYPIIDIFFREVINSASLDVIPFNFEDQEFIDDLLDKISSYIGVLLVCQVLEQVSYV